MANTITIVGLGNYDIDDLPLGIYKFLKTQDIVYARTIDHPVVQSLKDELAFESFDHVYEKHDQFEDVYDEIVEKLVALSSEKDIVYAVPGHPRVAETTTVKLQAFADNHANINVEILGGKSFIDDVFEAVNIDPNDGFTLLDATSLQEVTLNVRTHTLITQVYSAMVAADLKITLMERYPDDYPVQIVTGAHSNGAENVVTCPLYELDHDEKAFNNLTSVFIPKITTQSYLYNDFGFATEVIDTLVDDEKGCPWDKAQTHNTLKRYLLEETFELFEAIDNEDDWHMIEELGDILLQVLLHTSIGKKEGYMDIKEVITGLNTKMIHRHPHIFGNAHAESIEDLKEIWTKAKEAEGKQSRVKFEKVFAEHFLNLYEETKDKSLDEAELKQWLEKGERNK
ncbi:MazG nucleotide pyrophosphohydrolase domain-containing protein [Staphylococcus argenteus]|uniref:MazG nucleotide pyrophosphohydrolase domain-containing protein n=1 Tax=Staphylococcus argenteus TaxID=985002 RepID=UPI0005081BD4|nr:MazG nucleotide pyrophosphohydrolase domain-containing protein [Staphylococcus argenteus]MBE2135011.1 nucleotide pyrophosphohydrolase [Staphylococcus argenteus]MBE2147508.1 nucleotide pyrophosphohydrolase [Staphylococcus argenteus]MBE2162783.1 nucleotide pyrophosphohydrolase [Staphylococcus argenteus]MCG9798352.1 nucleotide pyrophosphohydrolase [Staphylococcus argenteus]MCG9800423.1 nucleotide pyrophosphohydrolase [Staphylococcus argenteus]